MRQPLKRDLYQVALWALRVLLGLGRVDLVLPRRLDLHNLVLLGALGVFARLEHYHALPADKIFRSPPELGVYFPRYCARPLVGLGLRAWRHTGEADHLSILSVDLEGPHEAVAELCLLLLYIDQLGVVSAVLKNLLHLHVHPETHVLASFELVTYYSADSFGILNSSWLPPSFLSLAGLQRRHILRVPSKI